MLKSLELSGFKSFADRTRFDFAPGITGIVGPNGSGKSNVVDAIKWILGDQSPKSLRGKEMADVIFNGAAGRKPSPLAEATLTLDNSSGFLPCEWSEVQIGRRLTRGGDAEYLINGEPARLKDVRELFLGTGSGGHRGQGGFAYCIIEQGRVDQILQAGAVNRRPIFEEAAGVSRYKHRKLEALKKLERVDQNLLRLTDIVEEVEAQLNSLRTQATKAAKFRDVSQELKDLWLSLAADDYRHYSAQLEGMEQAVGRFSSQIEEKNARLTELERTLHALDGEMADVDERLRHLERKKSADREAMVRHESTVRHETSRLRELDADVVRLRKQRTIMRARNQEVRAELDYVQQQLDQCERDVVKQTQALANTDETIRALTGEIDTQRTTAEHNRQRVLEQMRELSSAGQRVSGIESQSEAVSNAKAAAETRRNVLDGQLASCQDGCLRCREQVQRAGERVSEGLQTVQAIRRQRESLLQQQEDFQKTLAKLREQRSACQARKTVLEDLEDRQQGLGIGVKEILARAKTSDYPPWNRILGSVADLLHVELEQAALLEVALGDRAQLIVLQELGSMQEYLRSRSSQISGRVGFLEYAADEIEQSPPTATGATDGSRESRDGGLPFSAPSANPQAIDLTGHEGVRERADHLIQSPDHLPRLAEQLLADTWIVDTLDVAVRLLSDAGRNCRFVTLQGEVLQPDGTLIVGTVHHDQALISRKSELHRLKSDLHRLERSLSEEEHRLATLDESLRRLDGELDAAEAKLRKRSDEHAERKTELAARTQDFERLSHERESLDADVERLAVQERQGIEDLRHAQMQLAQREEDLQSLQADIERAERDVARAEHRLQRLKEKRTAEQLDSAKQQERLQSLRDAFRRLQDDQQQRLAQSNEADRRWKQVVSKRRKVVLHVLNTRTLLAEHFLTDERHVEQAALVSSEKERLRSRRSQLLQEEADLRRQRRELTEAQHGEEISARDVRHQISSIEKRCEEEYQLVLSDVVASGASAVRSYQAARSRSDEGRGSRDEGGGTRDEAATMRPPSSLIPPPSSHETSGSGDDETATQHGDDRTYSEVRGEIEAQVDRLRRKLKLMGTVSTDSLRDLDELEQRHHHLSTHLQDLLEAKATLEDIVQRINIESRRLFTDTFESIRGHFQELFRRAFGGGHGDVLLEDPDDVLECGIDIVARPPGKELKSISLMSGGEKTLTAFALLLAIFKSRSSPYCILDEVDAALDEANVGRMLAMLEEFRDPPQSSGSQEEAEDQSRATQFVLITHKKPSMTIADVLYGITMEESGVSKRMSVRFEDIRENGEFRPSALTSPEDAVSEDGQNRAAA